MAKDAKPAEEGATPPKKSKKLLIIILAVVLVVILAGGAAAFLLLKKSSPADGEGAVAEESAAHKKKEHEAPPVFVGLDTFTVNLVPEVGDQYLQVVLSLELENADAQAELTEQMPKIRNDVTLLLSSKKASELLPKEGKEHLAEELKNEINAILERSAKKGHEGGPVKSVLFTSFIIQ